MVRAGHWLVAAATMVMGSESVGEECERRILPPYAVQPPGASFEKHVSRKQWLLLLRETVHATCEEIARAPVRSTMIGSRRLAERAGARVAGCVSHGPGLPGHQCPEAGGPLTAARLTPLYDSEPAYRALMEQIAAARCRIDFMIFGWDDDEAGRAVAAALIARARAGVLVRVMIDRGGFVIGEGNAHVARGCPSYIDWLKAEPNIHVIETPDPAFRFDHRKVVVFDDRIVWTGSMILTRSSLNRWHNFEFLAEGAIVPSYAALFAERWESLGGCRAPTCPQAATIADVVPNAMVRMVRTDVDPPLRSLKEAVYGAVDTARHHIYLENPYFDDPILIAKLVAAQGRGVDVRAVLTMRGDVRTMNHFMALTANALLRGGARVFLYPAMTHVKAMAVDSTGVYMGTGNYDELSMRNNREVSLTVRGPAIVGEIEENLFLHDMAVSEELHALLPLPRGWFMLKPFWQLY